MTSASPAPRLVRSAGTRLVDPRRLGIAVLGASVIVGAWWFVLGQATGPIPEPATIVSRSVAFVANLLGASADGPPAYTQAASWSRVGVLVVDTLVMSVLAIGMAGIAALVSLRTATRLLTTARFSGRRKLGRILLALTRGSHAISRGVPELIWAMLIVFVLRPGILAGALALALHEFGVLGRLGSDVVDDLDPKPLEALKDSGASGSQTLLYGALPQVVPHLVTFLLYRWEMVIRATVVVGFITGAGLGHQLRLDLAFRRWTELAVILTAYVLLVWAVEAVASGLRRLAR